MLVHGKGELQWLLLPPFDNLLPKLALVLHPLELRLDVLLRDLEQTQDAVISFLRDHVQDVAESLRATLAPGFVDTKRHVFCALLPAQKLYICLALVKPFGVIETGAWEDAHNLGELHYALGQRRSAMFQIFEGFFVPH